MLTADQIEVLGDKAQQIISPITDFLIGDIARRISEAGQLTSTASYQVWRLQQLGMSQLQVKNEIRKRLRISSEELEQLMKQSAEVGYNFDIRNLPHANAVSFGENTAVQDIVSAAVQMAREDLSNMVQTIGFVGPNGQTLPLTQAYEQACDFAFQKVATGTQDYNSAIREATKGLAEKGIVTIDYTSGIHTSMEAAVRRNIMSALGIMQEKISRQNHDDHGCDGWEISAHAASAPDHEPIQGRQYSDEEYTALNNSLVRRIGMLNCGHAAFPIIFGVSKPQYSPEELEQLRRENEKGIDYDGKHYTMYEATQRQRKLERAIRYRKRRILIDETTGDKEQLAIDQTKLVRLNDEYARFTRAAKLRSQRERANIPDFGMKEAREAEKTAKNVFKNPPKDLKVLSARIDKALDQYCERSSKWSGNTVVMTRDEMPGANGRKEWNCDISIRNTAGMKTVVHEHLHARSISHYDEKTYLRHRNMEEGSVELFAQEICKINNVSFKAAYIEKVQPLQIINNILRNGNRYSFVKQLFDIPLVERYNWLRKQADDLLAKGILSRKTVQSLNDAVEFFHPKDVR